MQFEIQPCYLRYSRIPKWAVYIVIQTTNELRFLRSFYCVKRANDFVAKLKEDFAKGDYSYLTLRS